MTSSAEECAELEDSLIRAYEAELTLQQQQQQQQQAFRPLEQDETETNDDGSQKHDDDSEDPLEWMFGQQDISSPQFRLNPDLTSHKSEHIKLTQTIQGFALTAIKRKNTENSDHLQSLQQPDMSQHCNAQYILRGYFQANPTISALIYLSVDIRSKYLRGKLKRIASSKVVGIDCQLISSVGEDLSHLEKFSMLHTKKNKSLPDWLQKMSSYLEFARSREEHLRGFEREYSCECISRGVQVDILPRGDGLPQFTWEYNWGEEQDRLKLSSDVGTCNLDQRGLQDLVACTASCEKALELILKALQSS